MVTKKPSITYEIHNRNGIDSRIVTVEKPSEIYFIVFELIKFRHLPAKFPYLGITVLEAVDDE